MYFEFYKTLKDKRRWLVVLLIILIPMIDLAMMCYGEFADYLQYSEYYPNGLEPRDLYAPAMGSFLSGTSMGHIGQMLLIWLMPIYIFLFYTDSYIQEKSYHYSTIYFSKTERKTVYRNKALMSFLFMAGINFVSLLLNHILAFIILHNGTNIEGMNPDSVKEPFLHWCLTNLEGGYLIFLLSYCAMVGLYAVFCMNLAFIFHDRKIVYAIGIIAWIVMIMNRYSITYAMQPFIEYGLKYFLIAWCIVLGLVLISYCLVKLTWEKKDEI